MSNLILTLLPILVVCTALYVLSAGTWSRRMRALEHDLHQLSEAICQMAEMQMEGYQKLSASLGDIEERTLQLAVPSRDSTMPLERRHRVLALAHKGVGLDEIVRRLKIARGEAELILNLRRYMEEAKPRVSRVKGESNRYAQT